MIKVKKLSVSQTESKNKDLWNFINEGEPFKAGALHDFVFH
jgi:signal transduction histidine kinase